MEIEGLGTRCALTNCRKLDYLPVTCTLCNRVFCDEHHKPQNHACAVWKSNTGNASTGNTCPQCGAPLNGVTLGEHLKTCIVRQYRVDPLCALCNKRDPLAVKCPECNLLFCVQHRLPEEHQCTALATARGGAAAAHKRKLKLKLRLPSRKFVNTPQQPIGDKRVDPQERLTCTVHFAVMPEMQPRYMFFSRRWSAGKLVDDIVKRVPNLPKPSQGTRFVLYAVKASGGVNLLPHVTPVRDLPPGTVADGDALVLADHADGLPQEWVQALRPATSRKPWKKSGKGSGDNCVLC